MLNKTVGELYLNIQKKSYSSESPQLMRRRSSFKKSPQKVPNQIIQIFQSPLEEKKRVQSIPNRARLPSFNISFPSPDKSKNTTDPSFTSLTKVIPAHSLEGLENEHELIMKKLSSKIDAFKAPININIIRTLEDLALRNKSKRQEDLTVRNDVKIDKQAIDDKLNKTFSFTDKVINSSCKSRRVSRPSSAIPQYKIDQTNKKPMEKIFTFNPQEIELDQKPKSQDFFGRLESSSLKQNVNFKLDLSSSILDNKDAKNTNLVHGKGNTNEKEDGIGSISPLKRRTDSRIESQAIKSKPLNLLSQIKENKTHTNEKAPEKENKKIGQPRFYSYQGFATEKEREKMTSFLQDEFVNLMLLNRFHVNLDKFQVKDILNELNKKATQDKAIRRKFYEFMHTGVSKPKKEIIQEESVSPTSSIKVLNMNKVNQTRKLSISILSDRSSGRKSPEIIEGEKKQENNEENSNKPKRKQRQRIYSKDYTKNIKTEEDKKEDSKSQRENDIKGDQEKMMLKVIRLVKENEKLNKTFTAKNENKVENIGKLLNKFRIMKTVYYFSKKGQKWKRYISLQKLPRMETIKRLHFVYSREII